jgi:UDP-glucose 4-epimerase
MSTFVSGGAGFIGRYVIDRLHESGETVVSYDRALAAGGLPAEVVSVRGELLDVNHLAATMASNGIRRVVHAAGASDPLLSLGSPAAAVAANALGALDVLEASRHAGVDGRIVLLSSATVYGDTPGAVDERSPLRPRTPYAATKAFSDLLGQVYAHAYELDVVSLRFTEVYGPGRTARSALHEIVDAAVTRRIVELPAGAAHPYDVVHVEDVARAVTAALEASTPAGRIYDICGERVSLEQVVAIVRDRLPDVQIVGKPGESPRFETHGPISGAAADAELGYRPRWGLARGIDDLCAWLEAQEAC